MAEARRARRTAFSEALGRSSPHHLFAEQITSCGSTSRFGPLRHRLFHRDVAEDALPPLLGKSLWSGNLRHEGWHRSGAFRIADASTKQRYPAQAYCLSVDLR